MAKDNAKPVPPEAAPARKRFALSGLLPAAKRAGRNDAVKKASQEKGKPPSKGKFSLSFRKKPPVTKDVAGQPPVDSIQRQLKTTPIPQLATVDLDMLDDGVLQIDKVKYAVALSWRAWRSDRKLKDQAAAASSSSAPHDHTFYTDTRTTGMVGFGAPETGHRAGMRALILCINPALTGDRWIAAFPLGGSSGAWWIASMRDGKVFEDQIVRDGETARETFLSEINAPEWTRIICPADWGINGSVESRIGDVLLQKSGKQLKPVRPIRANLPKILFGAVVLGSMVGGYVYWSNLQEEQRAQLAEIQKRQRESVRIVPADYPWFESTGLRTFVGTCASEMSKAIISVPGWEQGPVACSVSHGQGLISTTWARAKNGKIGWLRASMPEGMPEVAIDRSGNKAAIQVSFETPKKERALEEKPWEPGQIQRVLQDRFQNLGQPIILNEVVERRSTGAAKNNRKSAAKKGTFNYHIVQIKTKNNVLDMAHLLTDVPALVPEILIYKIPDGSWDLLTKAYHPPILPEGAK